jgi:hypothetical protein
MCEAVEWLLTAQVERLREGQTFDADVLHSKFAADDAEPMVRAHLRIGADQRVLTRTASGAWLQEIPKGKAARIGDLLAILAPAAAAADAHHKTAISLRQNWLRGTRFLSAEALSALVDTDDSTIERRTQVFADLLGIRHLLDAERSCDRYRSELTSIERSIATSIQSLEKSATQLRLEIARANSPDGQARVTSSLAEIENAERQLGSQPKQSRASSSNLGRRIEAATAEHARKDRARLQRQTSFDRVAGDWNHRLDVEAQLKILSHEEVNLALQFSKIEESGRSIAAAVARYTEERTAAQNLLPGLQQVRDVLPPLIARLSQTLANASAAVPLPSNATFGQLRQALPEVTWTLDQIQYRLSQIRTALSNFSQAQAERERLQLLNARWAELQKFVQSEDNMAALRRVADQANARATEARNRFDSMAAPISRLQAAGREFLSHSHGETASDCPLCGHDWNSLQNLKEAVSQTLAGAPAILKIAERTAADAARLAREARATHQSALARRNDVETLRFELNAVSQAVQVRAQNYRELGVSIERSDARVVLTHFEHRLLVAQVFVDLYRNVDRFASTVFEKNVGSPLPDFIPLVNATVHLSELTKGRGAAIERTIALASANERAAIKERDRLRAEFISTQSNLRNLRERIAAAAGELEGLRRLWSQAAVDREWTPSALNEVRAELAAEAAQLAIIDTHIAAARKSWSTEVRQTQLSELEANIAPLKKRHTSIRRRLSAARRAAKTFHEAYTEISGRQVRALSCVVNPLFARMHANRVFDEIEMGQADNFLHWLATAGEAQLDPRTDFSQGQRQDLALALFLARARSLGGTFFLDEPVTHLDDLNRVGLLDVFRATVMEGSSRQNLVVTTASRAFARHLVEKFMNIGSVSTPEGLVKPLKVIELSGNARSGVKMNVYPVPSAA